MTLQYCGQILPNNLKTSGGSNFWGALFWRSPYFKYSTYFAYFYKICRIFTTHKWGPWALPRSCSRPGNMHNSYVSASINNNLTHESHGCYICTYFPFIQTVLVLVVRIHEKGLRQLGFLQIIPTTLEWLEWLEHVQVIFYLNRTCSS